MSLIHIRFNVGMEKNVKNSNMYTIARLLKSLGENVARFRSAKGYTLDRLSKESGVAISRISEIESRDAEDIQLSTVTKLAHVTGREFLYQLQC
jgi:hypothetical protein